MKFEWDPEKEQKNKAQHGVSFNEAMSAFSDPNAFVLKDEKHSTKEEERNYLIGLSEGSRVLTVRFTLRARVIRIFGATEWRKFRRLYYERTKD